MDAPAVLITGALAGIGRATAVAFARERARLVVSGRHEGAGKELAAELAKLGAEVAFVRADVRHEDDVRALIDAAVERFGRLDIAVNNAGTEGHHGPLVEQTAEGYASVFDTNVLGVLLGLKHELRVMIPQKRGSIVNLSSVAGIRGVHGAAIYVASKHAVLGLTRSAALEAAPFGVRVNAVAPGPVDTGMLARFTRDSAGMADMVETVPLQRVGTTDEIAQAILFVASDKASFLTGQVLVVDGGQSIGFGVGCH
ncbi:3-oxoacyl-[acyl-carrier protein] reductase [Minicystis rosea]|nr:3-oxoacyl-[acyl-carrier protein] reductase [Minicystis rosea]